MKRQRSECGVEDKNADVQIIGTHSGIFHCDEAFACYMLRQLPEYQDAQIFRSRDIALLRDKCSILVDVGSEFDHAKKWYDHHQKSFAATISDLRPDIGDQFKIRLSSAGLIYTYYGERVINIILQRERNISLTPEQLKICYKQIYRHFICEIDAIDNGVPMYENEQQPRYKINTNISARIGKLNPSWQEEEEVGIDDLNARFQSAMATVGSEFLAIVVEVGGSWIKAREYVRQAVLEAPLIYKTGEILMLQRFCPWKEHLTDLESEYNCEGVPKMLIYKDRTESWRVIGVPITPGSFVGRKFLPEPWRGLRDVELYNVAKLENLTFVHHTGFVGGASTKEAAIAMAIKSLEWK